MSFLIAVIIIILISFGISYVFNKKFEFTLPLTLSGISLLLYIMSFFNLRNIGVLIIIIFALISLITSVYVKYKFKRKISETLKSSGLIYAIVLLIIIYIIAKGFMFSTSNWDEYSHWALVLKNLFLSNNFGNLDGSTVLFKYYPQGISLFQNFTTSFSNYFSESSALAGLLFLSYAQLITIFSKIKYYDWKRIIITSIILFIIPLVFFDTFLNTICVDAVLALIFSNIIIFNYIYKKKDIFYAVYMSLQFYMLTNTKQIGIILALIAFLVIITKFIIENKNHSLIKFIKKNKNIFYIILIPLITSLLTFLSWKLYIKHYNIAEGFTSPSLHSILNIFSPNAPYYYNTTAINFVHHFVDQKQYGLFYFSFFLWLILMIISQYYIYKIQKYNKKYSFLWQLFLFIGLIIYMVIILIMYLISFTQYESTIVASFDRYIGTYFLGLFAITCILIINSSISNNLKNKISKNFNISILLFILLCSVPITYLVDNTIFQRGYNSARKSSREPYNDVIKYTNMLDKKIDKVFIISQNTTGLDYYILKYALTPIQTQASAPNIQNAWSIGKPYSNKDQWTIDISTDEWSKMLKDYTYVYLFKIDTQFIDTYSSVFKNTEKIKDKAMYRIDKDSGSLRLVLVE